MRTKLKQTEATQQITRRKHPRFEYRQVGDWDFFTYATGAKAGFIENVSEGGCLLRTQEPIDYRRWLRLIVKEQHRNIWFTAVGRVVFRQDEVEVWDSSNVTFYRNGVEFIHPLNALVLDRIRESTSGCANCGDPSANIPDLTDAGKIYCVLCHLRRACHNLLVENPVETEPTN